MKLNFRDINLKDIELVRYWRNQTHVKNNMLDSSNISSKNHLRWYESLDLNKEILKIYALNDIDIGVISCKTQNNIKKIFSPGIYCGNKEYLNHPVNFICTILMHCIIFRKYNCLSTFTQIKQTNKISLNANKKIGYEFVEKYNEEFDSFILKKNDFIFKTRRFKKIIELYLNKEDVYLIDDFL